MDDVINTHELIHSLNANNKEFMALKIDISISYDRVKWSFLDKVLTKFRFKGEFHKMIMSCVTTTKYIFMVNGKPIGFLSTRKGLRQGNPLSPYLFIPIAKVLGRNLTRIFHANAISGVKVAYILPHSTHL